MTKAIMSLTPAALSHARLLLNKRNKPCYGIRIGVKSGGCSGLSYYIEYADTRNQFDSLIQQQDVNILIDPKALMYLIGSEMDYAESKFKSGFVFNNPNQKASCGCGKSFNI